MLVSKILIAAMKTAGGLLLCPSAANLQEIYGRFINVSDFRRTAHICIKVFILFIKDAESFWGFTSAINWCYIKRGSDWCSEPSRLSMVSKSFQPIQLTFTRRTGHMHPNKKGCLAAEWKCAKHRESLSRWPCQYRQAEPPSPSLLLRMYGCLLQHACECHFRE